MDIKLSFKQKPWRALAKTLAIGYACSHALTAIATTDHDYFEARYLNPDIWNTTVTENHCFHAAPNSLIEVEPAINAQGQRVYKISQYSDINTEKWLYAKPLETQIHDRKIVGNTFCNGIVSISNMNLPFTKEATDISDANDGLLFADFVRHSVFEIMQQVHEMEILAANASTGYYSSTQLGMMDHQFHLRINNFNNIAVSRKFNHISALDGSHDHLDIPVNNGKQHLSIALHNLTAGEHGLNIQELSIATSYTAQHSLFILYGTNPTIISFLDELKEESRFLEAAAERDAVITSVDVRTDNFTVQRKGPSTVTEQGSK